MIDDVERRVMGSGSEERGKGYSKRGEMSKGVPMMDEGEWNAISFKLRRGLGSEAT